MGGKSILIFEESGGVGFKECPLGRFEVDRRTFLRQAAYVILALGGLMNLLKILSRKNIPFLTDARDFVAEHTKRYPKQHSSA